MEEEAFPTEIPDLPEAITGPESVIEVWHFLRFATYVIIFVILVLKVLQVVGRFQLKRAPAGPKLPPARSEASFELQRVQTDASGLSLGAMALDLSRLLKNYLDREYGADLHNLTTQEYWETVDTWRGKLPEELLNPVAGFLERCDEIKFQGDAGNEADKTALLAAAREIIEFRTH